MFTLKQPESNLVCIYIDIEVNSQISNSWLLSLTQIERLLQKDFFFHFWKGRSKINPQRNGESMWLQLHIQKYNSNCSSLHYISVEKAETTPNKQRILRFPMRGKLFFFSKGRVLYSIRIELFPETLNGMKSKLNKTLAPMGENTHTT